MGINLESSLALWVNFFGYFSSFLGLLLALVHSVIQYCFISFWTHSTSRHCSVPFSPPFFKPRPLSFAIFLATSVLVNSCSQLFSFKLVPWKISSTPTAMSSLFMGPSHRKTTKINLALFRLWPPCCATLSSPSSSCVRTHEQYR